jgi:hypothetical protein
VDSCGIGSAFFEKKFEDFLIDFSIQQKVKKTSLNEQEDK